MNTEKPEDRCKHGIRRPHQCNECFDEYEAEIGTGGRVCYGCGRIMSEREWGEQRICNDCSDS